MILLDMQVMLSEEVENLDKNPKIVDCSSKKDGDSCRLVSQVIFLNKFFNDVRLFRGIKR